MTHLEALDRQLAALDATPDAIAAEVALARGLAARIDADADVGAEVWREYRFALKALREVTGDSDVDESIADLIARLGGTDVRNRANAGT